MQVGSAFGVYAHTLYTHISCRHTSRQQGMEESQQLAGIQKQIKHASKQASTHVVDPKQLVTCGSLPQAHHHSANTLAAYIYPQNTTILGPILRSDFWSPNWGSDTRSRIVHQRPVLRTTLRAPFLMPCRSAFFGRGTCSCCYDPRDFK